MSRVPASLALAFAAILFSFAAKSETVDSLKAELAAKKAYIAKLQKRIRALETQPSAQRYIAPIVAPPVAPMAAPPGVVAGPALPDDTELEHALELTLVRQGALVLPAWALQVTPQFSYAHWDTIQNPFVKNSYTGALSVAMGLPWASQISVSVPYIYNQGNNGNPNPSGFADVGVMLSKELLIDNGGWIPNLVGSVGWTSPTSVGTSFSPIPYVSGFQAGLTASKRLDPLVVFASASYFSAASVQGTLTNPANVIAGRVGGSLAVSPATAVTAGFNLAYLTNPTCANVDLVCQNFVLPNSDRLLSSVDVGFSTLVGNRTLLNLTARFGVNGPTPNFQLIASVPMMFGPFW
jgi:hypothetical protein